MYTATYSPDTLNGERGIWYRCFLDGREVFYGWSRGHKYAAVAEVHNRILARTRPSAEVKP